MRPPEFTGGNLDRLQRLQQHSHVASMRPPEFTGGNLDRLQRLQQHSHVASMRPPEFTGGNKEVEAPCVPMEQKLQ